ncbi:MAG: hypothetical protein KA314_14270 [Chloroflexi bacterium]|nr:hypothetical protein [Chloroflexota bacterium]MBP8056999.1 hypothetical protein [Chloroflexota bacterium]
MTYYLFGFTLAVIGAYFGQRGAVRFTTWAKAKMGDTPMSQFMINAFMLGVGLILFIFVATLSNLTA